MLTYLVTLPNQSPVVFGLYQRWCYRKLLTLDTPTATAPTPQNLVRLYIMAVLFEHLEVQNAAIKALFKDGWHGSNVPETTFIYKNTKPGSPLRQLLVDKMVRNLAYEKYEELFGDDAINMERKLLCDLVLAERRSQPVAGKGAMAGKKRKLVEGDYLVQIIIEVD